ncbi:hypothetical protein V9T40_007104 [Parthenolecanium corni]|uniref:Uncharacterized protein n=1 Tax=Parthenolecanium corni TaxID=536013 RepID=A0AAN9TVR8_9HEMI
MCQKFDISTEPGPELDMSLVNLMSATQGWKTLRYNVINNVKPNYDDSHRREFSVELKSSPVGITGISIAEAVELLRAGEGGGGGGCGRPFGGLDGQLNVARVVRVCPCHSATSLAKDAADRRSLATHLRTAAVDVTRKWLSAISPQTMILLGVDICSQYGDLIGDFADSMSILAEV